VERPDTGKKASACASQSARAAIAFSNHYYTLLMAAACGPDGRVVACEPNPVLAETYQPQNLALNGFYHGVEICSKVSGNGSAGSRTSGPCSASTGGPLWSGTPSHASRASGTHSFPTQSTWTT
jgi:hypothetical protein